MKLTKALFVSGCLLVLAGEAGAQAPVLPTENTPAGQPLVAERIVFNWHNFLSGCSTWNLADWTRWTEQSQKLGYNAIMVHAYGNNPMAGFTFQGQPKPVGYLSTTVKGRDWSTMHVNDVRRLVGGEVFDGPVFGSDAGMVPDERRVEAAQALMSKVFADAAGRGMGVYFAVDVDTPSANPQELVTLLPKQARFEVGAKPYANVGKIATSLWLPNPDTPEGYAYYCAEVAGLLNVYPQITKLVVWFRRGGTPWMELKVADLPPAWQKEFAAEIARTPEAEACWHSAGLFAIGKIVRAFERARKECGAKNTQIVAGTWGFEFLRGSDRFFPAGVPLIGLDYDVIHERPQLGTAESRAVLSEVGAHRPVIPIIWAHHDDGHYIGRPYTPFSGFYSKLVDARAAGFGIIHWTTRPLDLYFASHARQVFEGTKDEPLRATCDAFAAQVLGGPGFGEYVSRWATEAPRFGRETSDYFIDRPLTHVASVIAGCGERLLLLEPAKGPNAEYYKGLERFIAAFYETHDLFQRAQAALASNQVAQARALMAQCRPEAVIKQFAAFSSIGGMTRGEMGLVVSLNTRWLAYTVRLRQMLGMEPVRYNFAPTSHDPLAQAPGRFTYFFDADHKVWQTLGTEETHAETFDAPSADEELGRHGLQSDKPITLTVRPILHKAALLPGDYRLRVLLLDPDSTAPGQRVFTVSAGGASEAVDIFKAAGGANRLLERVFPVTLLKPGEVAVTLTPVKGKAVVSGLVLERVEGAE
jgi:hypothetical protein